MAVHLKKMALICYDCNSKEKYRNNLKSKVIGFQKKSQLKNLLHKNMYFLSF